MKIAPQTEATLVTLILLVLAVPLAFIHSMRLTEKSGDTAFLFQIVENLGKRGLPYTQINASILAAMPTWGESADKVCSADLSAPVPPEINQFTRHAYFILYALAPLSRIIPVTILVPSAMVLAFISGLGLIYYLLRSRAVSPLASALFCLLVSVHPVWSRGLFAQPYSDRLALPFGVLFVSMLFRPKPKLLATFLVGLLCCCANERLGCMLGAVGMIHAIFGARLVLMQRIRIMGIAAIFLLWPVVVMSVLVSNEDYQGASAQLLSISGLSQRLNYVILQAQGLPFAFYNFIGLGIFCFVSLELVLIMLAVTLPNILIGVGGAELSGWEIHYHSQYFPFIAAAAAIGFSRLWSKAGSLKGKIPLQLLLAGLIGIQATSVISPTSFEVKKSALDQLAWVRAADIINLYLFDPRNSSIRIERSVNSRMRQSIPDGSVITAPEGFFPYLYGKGDLHYFPIAIDSADYAVLEFQEVPEVGRIYGGAISYMGAENKKTLDQCLTARLARAGYDLEHPTLIGGVAILKRSASSKD